ncbi:penicillin-binding protein 2 [Thiohalorhabdus methylotrophus]|uniref:Penicillin-binding protein 2 n=1 Tax=Thiohalorhabdus methylotrophus TaxID=3242694 RepID=A0ABV4TXQ6_9GAMM
MGQFAHFERRTRLVGLGLLGLGLILMGRLFYLQIEQFFHYRTLADENRITVRPVPPPRGLIYDRRGRLLVENEPAFALELYPEHVDDTSKVLDRLVEVLPSAAVQRDRMAQRLKESPPYLPAILIEGLNTEQVAKFASHQHRFPSIRIRARSQRNYLRGPLTAHVLGYLAQPDKSDFRKFDADLYPPGTRVGKMGLEREYEEILHGAPGFREVETDAFGRVVREISTERPEPGKNLILTLDEDLQKATHEALAPHPEASAVALNPETGGILAMASRPTFNPNEFIGGLSDNTWQQLRQDPNEPLVNRVTQGLYPPASTIKPVLAMAGLVDGAIKTSTEFSCNGTFNVGQDEHTFHCWKSWGHGPMTVDQAVVESCDVYFYKLAHRMGIEPIHKALKAFGLGNRTGIDLPSERKGLNPGPVWKRRMQGEIWYPGETVMTAIGQGYMEATPLQLGVMAAAVANGGFRVEPHLVHGVQDPVSGKVDYREHDRAAIGLVKEESLAVIRDAMRRVVGSVHGTAHSIAGGWIPVAGKTGTAQVVRIDRDKEEQLDPKEKERRLRDHALFVAFAPVEDPQIAVAVVVEHGISGGKTAGKVARKMIDSYFGKGS